MKTLDLKWKKRIFAAVVLASFFAILIYNFLTPLMSDDLLFKASDYHSPLDIFRLEYKQYMTWTGRSVLQIILKVFSLTPKWIFNICNSLCFVLLMFLLYWNIEGREKYNSLLYILINLLVWNFSVDFDQTVLWLGGACNYMWGCTIVMGYITCFRHFMKHSDAIKRPGLLSAFFFFIGVLAGWGNENTSGGAILITLLFVFPYVRRNRRPRGFMISGTAGMVIGFLFMALAPGNRYRSALMKADETYGGIMKYVSRGLKINEAVNRYMMLYIAVILILSVYLIYRGKKFAEFYSVFVFTLAGLATSYVLILTPEPMPRAYFGANIFFLVACVQVIMMLPKEETLLCAVRTGGILAACVWMFFSYTENGADLARILREVNEREEYILEQTGQGNLDLTLPMLRPQFRTEYSFMYDNDISEEKDFWINEVFRIKYGLNSLEAVPREEWDDLIGKNMENGGA